MHGVGEVGINLHLIFQVLLFKIQGANYFKRRRGSDSFNLDAVQNVLKSARTGEGELSADVPLTVEMKSDGLVVDEVDDEEGGDEVDDEEGCDEVDDEGGDEIDDVSLLNLLKCLDSANAEDSERVDTELNDEDDALSSREEVDNRNKITPSDFHSLTFYQEGRDYDRIEESQSNTRPCRTTRTAFGQMLLREQHGLSKNMIRDINSWVRMPGFNSTDVREYDMLRTRRKQLLPLTLRHSISQNYHSQIV